MHEQEAYAKRGLNTQIILFEKGVDNSIFIKICFIMDFHRLTLFCVGG